MRNSKIKKYKNKTRKNRNSQNPQNGGIPSIIELSIGIQQNKPGQFNASYITQVSYKMGGFFSSEKTVFNIEYIIPNNFLLINDPNSLKTPVFMIHFDGKPQNFSIQIEEPNNPSRIKFVEYLVKMNNIWYAMMRVYGLNTGFFAGYTNILFYRLNNKWFDLKTNKIAFSSKDVLKVDPKSLNILQNITRIGDNAPIIKLSPSLLNIKNIGYTAITSGLEFKALQRFRNEKLANAYEKEEAIDEGLEVANKGIFDMFFGNNN